MAQEIRAYTAVIPAGTAAAAPFTTDVSFPARVVEAIEIRVPPGPSGLVGFAIQNSGVTVIPYNSDAFIVTADEAIRWNLENYISSGDWQIAGYNTDTNDHAIYVRFLLDMPGTVVPVGGVPLVDNATLSSTGTESITGG